MDKFLGRDWLVGMEGVSVVRLYYRAKKRGIPFTMIPVRRWKVVNILNNGYDVVVEVHHGCARSSCMLLNERGLGELHALLKQGLFIYC